MFAAAAASQSISCSRLNEVAKPAREAKRDWITSSSTSAGRPRFTSASMRRPNPADCVCVNSCMNTAVASNARLSPLACASQIGGSAITNAIVPSGSGAANDVSWAGTVWPSGSASLPSCGAPVTA